MFAHIIRRSALPLLIGTLLLFAGCGGASTTSGNGATGTTPTVNTLVPTKPPTPQITNLRDYCNLVSIADVARITGLPISQVIPASNDAKKEVACAYATADFSAGGVAMNFFALTDTGQAHTGFATLKQQAQSGGAAVSDVSGIGDAAFTTSQGGANSMIVLKGTVVFLVGSPTDHPLPADKIQQIAQLVATRL